MAKDIGDIRLVGTAQANAANWQRIVRDLGLSGRGNVIVGDVEIVTLTPGLQNLVADRLAKELAKTITRRTKR